MLYLSFTSFSADVLPSVQDLTQAAVLSVVSRLLTLWSASLLDCPCSPGLDTCEVAEVRSVLACSSIGVYLILFSWLS